MDTATCIVALKQGGKIYLGADSAGVNTNNLRRTIRMDKKVFQGIDREQNIWQFGFTTSFRMGQLIQYDLQLDPINEYGELKGDIFGHMVNRFIPSLQQCFRRGGFEQKEKEKVSGGQLIVAVKNSFFRISEDYQVAMETENYTAIGCGDALALGALYATKDMKDPKKRILTALKAAEAFSAGVARPFHIISA